LSGDPTSSIDRKVRPPIGADDAAAHEEHRLDRSAHAAIARLSGGFSPMGLAEAWLDWAMHLSASPQRLGEIAHAGGKEVLRLAMLSAGAVATRGVCVPCERALPYDKRFRDPRWQQWPFAIYASNLLAWERWWDEATRDIHGATPHHLELLNFVGRQYLDTLSPSNFAATNPEVLDAIRQTGGRNLVEGAVLAAKDAQRTLSHQRPESAEQYVPGLNVAVTPGRVVHRTPLAEIIQYAPVTGKVHPEPLVIVPAWIMKYYILDLAPQSSLVRHLTEQGFTVFMVSWKNPGPEDRETGFDDYRRHGVMAALDAATTITGARKVHSIGYCIGGTLLSVAAAAMARDGDDRLASLTLFTAQTDFEEAGELRTFIDESQLALLDDMMVEKGVLEGSQMAGSFHLLRSNDLIWSKVIRRYLLGRDEPMDEMAAWSTDATRMPARMHSEYLRAFYLNNDLAEGRFRAGGGSVDLGDIRVPVFAVGTEADYVAPWRSAFRLHRLVESDVTFVLANRGHNQGIISPPGAEGRYFRIGTSRATGNHVDAEQWLARHERQEGSWWPAWFAWLEARSGAKVAPPPLGRPEAGFAATDVAPGRFVHG